MNYTVIAFTDLSKNQSIVPYPILAIGCQSLAINRAVVRDIIVLLIIVKELLARLSEKPITCIQAA